MTIKKILITLLSLVFVFAVSCSSDLGPDASQSNDDDLINNPDATIAAFVNDHAGVYYEAAGYADYKLRNGKVRNIHGAEVAVEKTSRAEGKLQIRNANEGTVEVLKFDGKGYTSYTSYVLEKSSSDVSEELKAKPVGGHDPALAQYAGTYKDVNRSIENFIAIDGSGYIYFYDTNVTVANKRVGITGNELTILETQNNETILRKLIFKFDQGVYREYNVNGSHIEVTGERFTRTRDFVEDLANTIYVSADNKNSIAFNSGGAVVIDGTADYPEAIRVGNTIKIKKIGVTITINGDSATYKPSYGSSIAMTKKAGNNVVGDWNEGIK
ncbi:hypothetical protein [Brachyspira sp.]|uniref:hypothetical protein n=1 Tax=Brachyspira sp. TaxID=1977261 RepID=UPI003D7E0E2A